MHLGPVASSFPHGARRERAVARGLAAHAEHGGAAARGPEDLVMCGCLVLLLESYWLSSERVPLPAVDDEEGVRVPASLPPVIDAHVHVFPDPVFDALWRWFETHAWPVRYKLRSPELVRFLLDRGVDRVVALHYGHKPGMARGLNAYVAELCRSEPRLVGLATVLPGEPDAPAILAEAKALGLRGVKLHCHVQTFAPDSEAALEVFSACAALDLPVVVHAGREPRSAAYRVDPYTLCSADRIETVLRALPGLRLCVPHFGADELEAYAAMLERHDGLYLDTTMTLSGFLPGEPDLSLLERRPERILFGTDFPNLPYAWDRELKRLTQLGVGDEALAKVLAGTARELFGL